MISAIENAIIARIAAAQAAPAPNGLGYTLKKLATYGGEFSDGVERIVTDFPAVLLAFGGAQPVKTVGTITQLKGTFSLICCATSLRNEKAARHGKDGKIGTYQIFTDMLALLTGQTLGLDITPLTPSGIRPLMNDKAGTQLASIYGLDFETTFSVEAKAPTGLDDFETFHGDWDITTHGNVTPPLPTAEADARDHLTLPIQGENS
jgi:phage gp37-like protein